MFTEPRLPESPPAHTGLRYILAAASSQCLCNIFLNILRTAKFWQSTQDSSQSDGWVAAAAPHSQLSPQGIWETRCPCQLVLPVVYFLVSTELSPQPGRTGNMRTAITPQWPEREKRDADPTVSPFSPSSPHHQPLPSPLPPQQYLRLTGKGHAKDGDTAENAFPANVADPLQPLPTKEAMLEGGQHNLDQKESETWGQETLYNTAEVQEISKLAYSGSLGLSEGAGAPSCLSPWPLAYNSVHAGSFVNTTEGRPQMQGVSAHGRVAPLWGPHSGHLTH